MFPLLLGYLALIRLTHTCVNQRSQAARLYLYNSSIREPFLYVINIIACFFTLILYVAF